MPSVTATVVMECELAGVGGGWTDISADTRIGIQAIEVQYGIGGSGPLDRIAETGTMSWAMDNSSGNSGGVQGYYSPGHTNARANWDLGIAMRLKVSYGGTDYYKFRGTLIDVQPDAGQYQRQAVICSAVDWMDEAARSKIKGIAIQEGQRSDQLVSNIVTNAVTRQPSATDYETGQSTFAFALDNLLDGQTSVLRALADVTISELGYLYVKGDTAQGGTLKFEDRHARARFGAAVGSFDNSMVTLDVTRSRSDLINRVYVVVHPRTVAGSATVLYELTSTESVPSVSAGETIKITALFKARTAAGDEMDYRIAGKTITTPESGIDWIANSAEDGSGSNLTASVNVTLSVTAANAVEFSIENTAAVTAYLTTLQVRGIAVTDVSETVVEASDSASQTTYGEIDTRVDMKYESNTGEFINNLSAWLLNTYKDPRYVVKQLSLAANTSSALMTQALAREPGDKITIAETMTGIVEAVGAGQVGYFINGVQFRVSGGGMIRASWTLSPGEAQAFWILETLGASELGLTTRLGFA
jgi:hypothetical protein